MRDIWMSAGRDRRGEPHLAITVATTVCCFAQSRCLTSPLCLSTQTRTEYACRWGLATPPTGRYTALQSTWWLRAVPAAKHLHKGGKHFFGTPINGSRNVLPADGEGNQLQTLARCLRQSGRLPFTAQLPILLDNPPPATFPASPPPSRTADQTGSCP